MEEIFLDLKTIKSCAFCPMMYNNTDSSIHSDVVIVVSLNEEEVKKLSLLIWKGYVQILVENLENDYDFDFEGYEEPYPKSKTTILDEPLLLQNYIKNSGLWRDIIFEKFLFPVNKERIPKYYIIGFKGVEFNNSVLNLSFLGYKKGEKQ